MAKLLVSFERQNFRLGTSEWLFSTRNKLRFEWLALLAVTRTTTPPDQAWVTLDEIGRLPSWAGKDRHHAGTNIGRYLQSLEKSNVPLISAKTRWAGPYRLQVPPLAIEFDVPIAEARKRLRLRRPATHGNRDQIYRFTKTYARSQWLMFQGNLVRSPGRRKGESTAYDLLMALAREQSFNPTLRLVAVLGAVQVFYRLGQFGAARRTLLEHSFLLRRTNDRGIKAQFHLALAWSYQRGSSGAASDRAVETALNTASGFAEDSGDRAALGLVAHRNAGYLTKHGWHAEAINQLLLALEAALITGNYDRVQATCGNMGSILHRLGPDYYTEARRWLLLGIAIARWMRVGKEDAHGEMILGKIYVEQEKCFHARLWLKQAQRIAESARNQLNLADIRMTWGFWHQCFGTRENERDTLIEALKIFRSLKEFDCQQKENYIARKFPTVWPEVAEALYSSQRPR